MDDLKDKIEVEINEEGESCDIASHLDRSFEIQQITKNKKMEDGKRLIFVIISCFLYAISLRFFSDNVGLLPGGFAGLSKLIQRLAQDYLSLSIPFSALNIGFNVIPAIFAYFLVGKKFVIFSAIYVFTVSFLIDAIPMIKLADDTWINILFGGVIHGLASTIVLNANASGGGTDFVSMIISNKYNISIWNYVLAFNIMVLLTSGLIYGFEIALYSVVFQAMGTIALNKLYSRFKKKTILIIAEEPEPLATELMRLTGHGITTFDGIGRYSGQKRVLLYMVVSQEDVHMIKKFLKNYDKMVFMNISDCEDLSGRFILRPID